MNPFYIRFIKSCQSFSPLFLFIFLKLAAYIYMDFVFSVKTEKIQRIFFESYVKIHLCNIYKVDWKNKDYTKS